MGKQRLTRSQVLAWNEAWSDRDRARVANALDVLPEDAHAYVPASKAYVGVMVYGLLMHHGGSDGWYMGAVDGTGFRSGEYRGLVIHKGSLEWPEGRWSKDLDPGLFPELYEDERVVFDEWRYFQWVPLSTVGRTGPHGAPVPEQPVRLCPVHFTVLPTTNVCDLCD